MSRYYTYLGVLIGAVCVYFIVRVAFFTDLTTRTVVQDVIQGVLVGVGLALVTAMLYGRARTSRVNGWTTMYGCGRPGNGIFFRAAQAWTFAGPITVPEEGMYWFTSVDGSGRRLNGAQRHVLRFPAGQLPPTEGFWSLTMGDGRNHFVENPLHRFHVGDRSGLVPNEDGSVDVLIQEQPPEGRESNWLPAPAGDFILWFRVDLPGRPILDRAWVVPPVTAA